MNKKYNSLRDFYILWSTQSLSQLGSAITGFALTLWLYEKTGSAVGARIVEKFDDAEERKRVADILMTSGDFEDTSEDERRKAFADFVMDLKKDALEREIEDAMAQKDGERLKTLLEEENGLEKLRGKLNGIRLSRQC